MYSMSTDRFYHCSPVLTFHLFHSFCHGSINVTLGFITTAWRIGQQCLIVFSTFQSDELSLQKKLRTEVIQLEDTLAQVRKEYEMLRIEFEQNLAANEQAGKTLTSVRNV